MNLRFSVLFMLLLVFAWASALSAQEFTFKVLIQRGDNHYKKVDANWEPVKQGDYLQSSDYVKVGAKSYLGLIHSSGRTAELIEPGERSITEIESNSGLMRKGLPARYNEFVMNTVSDRAKSETMTRGKEDLQIYLPSSGRISDEELLLVWKKKVALDTYKVIFYDALEEVIYESEFQGSSAIIDLNREELRNYKLLLVQIKTEGSKSTLYAISKLSDDEKEKVNQELDSIFDGTVNPSSLDLVLQGAFYEENNLIIDAMRSYYQSVEGDLENELLISFLRRNILD